MPSIDSLDSVDTQRTDLWGWFHYKPHTNMSELTASDATVGICRRPSGFVQSPERNSWTIDGGGQLQISLLLRMMVACCPPKEAVNDTGIVDMHLFCSFVL